MTTPEERGIEKAREARDLGIKNLERHLDCLLRSQATQPWDQNREASINAARHQIRVMKENKAAHG